MCIEGEIDVEELDKKYREALAELLAKKQAERKRARDDHGA